MADAPEQITSKPEPTARLDLTPPPLADGNEAYRPLSLMAIGGLLLAVLYAFAVSIGGLGIFATRQPRLFKILLIAAPIAGVLVGVLGRERRAARLAMYAGFGFLGVTTAVSLGSLIAFSGSNPWLLPTWTLLMPIVAAVICWMARVQIQNSEGTLSGRELTTWGLGLSLFFGLNYAAYMASNTLAVRTQASEAAEEFLELLKEGKVEEAFIRSLPPRARPPEQYRRHALESVFNRSRSPRDPGLYSGFTYEPYVRLLQQSETVKWTRLNSKPTYDKGGYQVEMNYRVTTNLAEFTLLITVFGIESKSDKGGRDWYVILDKTRMENDLEQTEESKELEKKIVGAKKLAYIWTAKLRQPRGPDDPIRNLPLAYLDTLSPKDRQRLFPAALVAQFPLEALRIWGPKADPKLAAEFERGYATFKKGSILNASYPGTFWAKDEAYATELTRDTRELFDPTKNSVDIEIIDKVTVPRFSETTDKDGTKVIRVALAVRVILIDLASRGPKAIVEGELICEALASSRATEPEDFTVKELVLIRGSTVGPAEERKAPGR